MYKLCVYIPEAQLEMVKRALFDAGAGRIGNYSHCCWQVLGTGQFLPGEGSEPFLGDRDRLETVSEYRVEMVCEDRRVDAVVEALREAHPYEQPAFDLIRVEQRFWNGCAGACCKRPGPQGSGRRPPFWLRSITGDPRYRWC